jgi:hypothetical protein
VAESLAGLGDAFEQQGSPSVAETHYRRAVELLAALEQEGRANSASQSELNRVREILKRLAASRR